MKKILVPCDFSEAAVEAYHFAMNVAARSQADVIVLKIIDLPFVYETAFSATPYTFDPSVIKEIEAGAKDDFEKMKSQCSRTERVTFIIQQGPVTPTIRQVIANNKVDLVVMGTHGASGLKEYFIGSNTEKIVRTSSVPVIAIRKSFELSQIKNIVFPTTLELNQHNLVNQIKEWQSFFSARLHLLVVNTPNNFKRTHDQTETMKEFVKHYKLTDYTLNIRSDLYESDGIINFAHEIKTDMIFMGTHGRRGLAHLFTGSVAEDVVNHAMYPIWTYVVKKSK